MPLGMEMEKHVPRQILNKWCRGRGKENEIKEPEDWNFTEFPENSNFSPDFWTSSLPILYVMTSTTIYFHLQHELLAGARLLLLHIPGVGKVERFDIPATFQQLSPTL